jgi:hypothetical protein
MDRIFQKEHFLISQREIKKSIHYKFSLRIYNEPLIYNKKMLNKKDIDLIEKSGIELYHTKKFGELLGYGKCALNKYSVGNISIHFLINKVGDNLAKYEGLFGLACNLKSLDTKYYFDLFVKMNRLKTFSF